MRPCRWLSERFASPVKWFQHITVYAFAYDALGERKTFKTRIIDNPPH